MKDCRTRHRGLGEQRPRAYAFGDVVFYGKSHKRHVPTLPQRRRKSGASRQERVPRDGVPLHSRDKARSSPYPVYLPSDAMSERGVSTRLLVGALSAPMP